MPFFDQTGNTSSMYVTWVTDVYYGEGSVHLSVYPVPLNSTYSEWSAATFTVPHYSDDEDLNKQVLLFPELLLLMLNFCTKCGECGEFL